MGKRKRQRLKENVHEGNYMCKGNKREGKGRSWAGERGRGKRAGERKKERLQKSTCWHEREMRWRQRPRQKGVQRRGERERDRQAEKEREKNKKEHNGQCDIGRDEE